MSRTYSIGCKICRESLWIGQGWPKGKRYIYKGKKYIEALEKFLFDHENHDLIFIDDEDIFGGEGKRYDEDQYLSNCEVVGNIYENPEMLQGITKN